MIRYDKIWQDMTRYEKRMFLGPLSTPPRWHLDGRTSPGGQPTGHRPVPRAEMSVAWNGRCCCSMERSSGEEEAPNTHVVPLGGQTTMCPMPPAAFESSWFIISWRLWTLLSSFASFLCIFGTRITFSLSWSYCCMKSVLMFARLVKVWSSLSEKTSIQTFRKWKLQQNKAGPKWSI